jgi:hypothetical protein
MPAIQASVVIAHGVEVVEDRRRRVPDCWIMNILSEVKALNREVNQVSNLFLLADLRVGHAYEARGFRG